MKNRILVVAAHPDDEVLGCGGTIARLSRGGYSVFTLILGEGITSRDDQRDRENRKREIDELNAQAKAANKMLGVKKLFLFAFPDNRFDTVSFLDIVKTIESVKRDVEPYIIFTHYGKDLNIDHRLTYQAVITASRPLKNETVKEIYSFEVPSSTEWACPNNFVPDVFFDVSKEINLKLKAIKIYAAELKKYPHPRSVKGIGLTAQTWGMKVGLNYAEAFKTVRVVR